MHALNCDGLAGGDCIGEVLDDARFAELMVAGQRSHLSLVVILVADRACDLIFVSKFLAHSRTQH